MEGWMGWKGCESSTNELKGIRKAKVMEQLCYCMEGRDGTAPLNMLLDGMGQLY